MEDFSNKVSGPKQWFFVPIRTYREETNENYEIQGEVFLSSENKIKNIWGNKNQDKKPVWSMEGRETKATKNVKLWETWEHEDGGTDLLLLFPTFCYSIPSTQTVTLH